MCAVKYVAQMTFISPIGLYICTSGMMDFEFKYKIIFQFVSILINISYNWYVSKYL